MGVVAPPTPPAWRAWQPAVCMGSMHTKLCRINSLDWFSTSTLLYCARSSSGTLSLTAQKSEKCQLLFATFDSRLQSHLQNKNGCKCSECLHVCTSESRHWRFRLKVYTTPTKCVQTVCICFLVLDRKNGIRVCWLLCSVAEGLMITELLIQPRGVHVPRV